ncbi:Uncharacterized protein APZ42_018378 [Daphnia magna]|uniref:Uncharacterized protein n=1 Tax=Daphnia magna TaxID=35525 RepID=A0A164Z5M1_9CRUS|nr:Uncharacterized protein APZ42_018378 [Daphnia magna]
MSRTTFSVPRVWPLLFLLLNKKKMDAGCLKLRHLRHGGSMRPSWPSFHDRPVMTINVIAMESNPVLVKNHKVLGF